MHQKNKLVQLDALRGIACLIVVLHHYSLAFMPKIKNAYPNGLGNTPLYIFVNGSAAVSVFFVLSGFVLSRKFFHSKLGIDEVISSAIKRFPRLYLPAAASILLGYLIFYYIPHYFIYAGELTESNWLKTFANSSIKVLNNSDIYYALKSSYKIFTTNGYANLNSNLWTMRPEFLGSIAVFFFIGLFTILRNQKEMWLIVCTALLLWCLGNKFVFVLPFFLGMFMAAFSTSIPSTKSLPVTVIILLLAIFFLRNVNYYENLGASILLIYLFISNPTLGGIFSGRISNALGRLSFPLYLTHTLVICTLSSYVYIHLSETKYIAIIATLLVTFIFSIVASIPFILLDEWWVKYINRKFKKFSIGLY